MLCQPARDGVLLVLIERCQEQPPHVRRMRLARRGQAAPPGRREGCDEDTAIAGRRDAADQALRFQHSDNPGQAAPAEHGDLCEVRHAQPAAGRRKLEQHLVLDQGHAVGGDQVGIEQPHQPGVNLKEAAPDRQISWVEPRRHGAGRFTGRISDRVRHRAPACADRRDFLAWHHTEQPKPRPGENASQTNYQLTLRHLWDGGLPAALQQAPENPRGWTPADTRAGISSCSHAHRCGPSRRRSRAAKCSPAIPGSRTAQDPRAGSQESPPRAPQEAGTPGSTDSASTGQAAEKKTCGCRQSPAC